MIKSSRPIDWSTVKRVLVIKLRSIGDTVLTTPSLAALRRHIPEAQIDILLEDWVAPLLEGNELVDDVVIVGQSNSSRLRAAREIRSRDYDVVINQHGGTTATLLTLATGAPHRVGFAHYQFPFVYHHLLSSSADYWGSDKLHSAEQQLALLGFVGVPVEDRPASRLTVMPIAVEKVSPLISDRPFAVLHPASAFHTKQWDSDNFARVAENLAERGIASIAVAAPNESAVLDHLGSAAKTPITKASELSLPEITALVSRATVFVGNDSGIAHIAAAVGTPSVVIFGSSNRVHWRPWTEAQNEVVFREFSCQPCPGYECKVYGSPRCILEIDVSDVTAAVDRVLDKQKKRA